MPLQPDFDKTILRVLQEEAGFPAATAAAALERLKRDFRQDEEVGNAQFPILNVTIRLNELADAALDRRLPAPPKAFPWWIVLAVLRWFDGMMPVRGEFREGEAWRPNLSPGAREAVVCLALRERQRAAAPDTGTIPKTDAASLSLRARELAGGHGFGEIGPEDVAEALQVLEEMRCLGTVRGLRTVAPDVTVQEFDEY